MLKYQARLADFKVKAVALPDEYDPLSGLEPSPDFIISRNADGTPLSYYADIVWDLSPYYRGTNTCKLNFAPIAEAIDPGGYRYSNIALMRRLMLILIYVQKGPPLAAPTLVNYLYIIRSLSLICEIDSKSLSDALADGEYLVAKLNNERGMAADISSLLVKLWKIDPEVLGLTVVGKKTRDKLRAISIEHRATHKQTPPIPTRIYSLIVGRVSEQLVSQQRVVSRLIALVREIVANPLMGLSRTAQNCRKKALDAATKEALGVKNDTLFPCFEELIQRHGLSEFWSDNGYKVVDSRSLKRALTDIQIVASLQVQIFTGMRREEVETLPFHCLVSFKGDGEVHYKVVGHTTKFNHGLPLRAEWITSESGRDAILLAQTVSRAIYLTKGLDPNDRPDDLEGYHLFVSPEYALDNGNNTRAVFSFYDAKRKYLWNRLIPVIEVSDIVELEFVDPLRHWRLETDFEIGRPWPLATHQFRRSLVLYAQRSGLVTLPSLKRQLKHITREMVYYYGRGSAFAVNLLANDEGHIAREFQEASRFSSYLAFMRDALLPDIFGGQAHFLKIRMVDEVGVVRIDRAVTLNLFKEGKMAYTETLLGGCTRIDSCDKNPLDLNPTACVVDGCSNLLGQKRKLENFVRAQEEMVKNMEPNTPNYRHEISILNALRGELVKLIKSEPGATHD